MVGTLREEASPSIILLGNLFSQRYLHPNLAAFGIKVF